MAIIGIDLGTSNSLVSYWDGNRVQLIKNQFENVLTPSVVGIDDSGELLIGAIAKERLISHPQLTIAAFKRFMGTEKNYQLGAYTFTPTELSSIILKTLKQDAEAYLNETCHEAIISVPAYFNNTEREATIEAAKLAGLDVHALVSEPTAAAIAYGFHKKEDQMILVVDLGGGTFDVSLLEMFDGVMQVEAIAGDNHLGGEDFTTVIVKNCLAQNQLSTQILPATLQSTLHQKAELLKKHLSVEENGAFQFEFEGQTYDYLLTQKEYEQLCQPLLDKMRKPISRVLNDANITTQDIDQVILIGGATKSFIIRNYFSRLLKAIPYTQINPDEAVGLGAGIQSALKKDRSMIHELILTDVCAHTLGVDSVSQIGNQYIDNIFSPIIERNTTIPVSIVRTFYTLQENQTQVMFSIYQGESPNASDNLKIGELTIDFAPCPENTPIDCRFTYDTNGVLEVIVSDKTGKSRRLLIESTPGKLTPEQMEESLQKLATLKVHPKDRAENRLLLARLERLYMETTGEMRQVVQGLMLQFQQILEKQDEKLTKRKISEILKELNRIESGFWHE